ncbi:hypothetical protein IAD21_03958 [Abditibacteriota bacterium]|nr:hypothetical protein IAD21_03958 [Abditibacteriota bacterium]
MNENETQWERKPSSIPAIEIQLWMKATIYGGRRPPFTPGYCPHLVVKGKATFWGIRVLAITKSLQSDIVFPGDEAILVCEMRHYAKDFDYGELKRGATFEMREGPRVVGTGVVLSDFEW